MENLIFSLNSTLPVFLLMVLGVIFRKVGLIDAEFANKLNKFVFKVPLPVLVFKDLAVVDFASVWDGKFVLFCFAVTVASIVISYLVALLFRNRGIRGEFVQASYRSSAALLGIAFIQNIYGTSGMAPLMIIGSVPLYNIMAVVVLSVVKAEKSRISKETVKLTLLGIVKNPILIGIAAGLLWSALGLPLSGICGKTVSNISAMATPLGLIAMGAGFELSKAVSVKGPSFVAAFIKLVGLAALFLPLAVMTGFRNEELIAILVMLSSATTVSAYVMARNMGHEGVLTSSVVMLTTLFSAFTVTGWLWILKSMGFI